MQRDVFRKEGVHPLSAQAPRTSHILAPLFPRTHSVRAQLRAVISGDRPFSLAVSVGDSASRKNILWLGNT